MSPINNDYWVWWPCVAKTGYNANYNMPVTCSSGRNKQHRPSQPQPQSCPLGSQKPPGAAEATPWALHAEQDWILLKHALDCVPAPRLGMVQEHVT